MPRRLRLAALVSLVAGLLTCVQPSALAAGEDPGAAVVLRTYRLALLSDPSYAAAVAPGAATEAVSDAQVLAAKQALVDRLNQVYGEELAIRFTLAPGTVDLNLRNAAEATDAYGPCGVQACFTTDLLAAGCADPLLARTRYVIGQLIGARNYEVGHLVLGAATAGASYASSAGTEYRAYGCSGAANPTGDAYALDRLAHELGHQLGAGATMNGPACPEERNVDSAVEPGSGASIMGAAGTCGADDLQAHPGAWFSATSLDEIGLYVTGQGLVPDDAVAAEVQSVALTGFDGTDSFKLAFGGTQTATITRGVNYTQDGVKAAVLAALPSAVISKVRPYWQTGTFDDRGFEMTFASFANVVEPTVVPVSGTFTAQVNDIDAGGLQYPGGTASASGNKNPVVTGPASRTIPVRTPFALTGSATDADGDPIVYQWQQVDLGADAVALKDPAKVDGPLFRTDAPVSTPTRSFPDLAQVLADNTNAAAGTCATGAGEVECYSEWLPTASYTPASMTFRLVARDRDAAGGGTATKDVTLLLDKTTGPFRVTSQAAGEVFGGGTDAAVTWTANTSALAANVKISLSTDGGQTFPTVLAASTPNDGSHTVTLPEVATAAARIKVEAVGNYFFDVSHSDFTIANGPPETLTVTGIPASRTVQHSDALTFSFTAASTETPLDELTASLDHAPPGGGFSVTKTAPGAWTVAGTVNGDVGANDEIRVLVEDGVANELYTTGITVVAETATVAYDGDTAVTEPAGGPAIVVHSATVTQEDDGHPGDVRDATVVFTNAATGAEICTQSVALDGTASCGYAVYGDLAVDVEARVEGNFVGTTAAPTRVVVDGWDYGDTSITSAPPTWVLGTSASVVFAASKPGSTFECTLDAVAVPCTSSPLTLSGLSPGSHRFTVAARDPDGFLDPSPSVASFTVPVDDRGLSAAKGRWKRKSSAAAYAGTYTMAKATKAELRYRVTDARSLALLVGTASGQGKVKVYLDGSLLRTVNLGGPSGWKKLTVLATFATPRSGVVRIVTKSTKPVRIDGLGVSTL